MVRTASAEVVLQALYELVDKLDDGARLPTVRDLMKRFHVSQSAVQEAFNRLREEGLATSQVGRGSYVIKLADAATRAGGRDTAGRQPESLLILSNSSMNERCVLVQQHIVADMVATGGKVVQMSYHDTDHLLVLLRSVPSFDAVILQSHYEVIPIRLLHLLQQKTRALVVDGHTLSGVDVDRIGTDWEESLALALDHLTGLGHRRIGMVSLESTAQPIVSVRRAFARLRFWGGVPVEVTEPLEVKGLVHPTQSVDPAFEATLSAAMAATGALPFSALVTIGLSDGLGIRRCLDRLGLGRPGDLSVHMLGHHNVPTEHIGYFTMAGSSHEEAARQMMAMIRRRLRAQSAAPEICFLACREVVRGSTAAPERDDTGGRIARRRAMAT